MVKKTVSRLKKGVDVVKLITPVKNKKTGSYSFREEIIDKETVKQRLKK